MAEAGAPPGEVERSWLREGAFPPRGFSPGPAPGPAPPARVPPAHPAHRPRAEARGPGRGRRLPACSAAGASPRGSRDGGGARGAEAAAPGEFVLNRSGGTCGGWVLHPVSERISALFASSVVFGELI